MSRRTGFFALLAGLASGTLLGFFGSTGVMDKADTAIVTRDTVTVTDTVLCMVPAATDSVRTRYVTRCLPVARRDTVRAEDDTHHDGEAVPPLLLSDERDSMAVELPITQKRYDGEDYRAYVSGYEASLDSIFVYARTTTIRERGTKPPGKWHIGLTAGCGLTGRGVQPYVGIGVTYILW